MRLMIVDFHEQIKLFVPYQSYVFDVFFNPETNRMYMIECNPFFGDLTSGSCLFDWIKDHQLIHEGPQNSSIPLLRVLKTKSPIEFFDI